ncbi:hypothetical protein FQN53_000588 [Emmonsiellopsis sp. PD_33]|nr:hypothetical protein FQN53_000588 [Emmonsiellopsis sp. PD_33]
MEKPIFKYPDIPLEDQDLDEHPQPTTRSFHFRHIEKTTSSEWGAPDAAATRALVETNVNTQNESLLRTYHPSLASVPIVWVIESPFGPAIWAVSIATSDVEVAGRDVHLIPCGHRSDITIPTPYSSLAIERLFTREINPRKILTARDLDSLRELFPRAVGAQVLIAGFIVILFRNMGDLRNTEARGRPHEIGGLIALLDVAGFDLTDDPICSDVSLGDSPAGGDRAACLGIKLKLPGGQTVLTTVTHTFIKTPALPALFYRIADWLIYAKEQLSRYCTLQSDREGPMYGMFQERSSNSPIGRTVWMLNAKEKIGTIMHTYDRPSGILPYPAGYSHDLCLVSDPQLPDIESPMDYPTVEEWAKYSEIRDGARLYAVRMSPSTDKWGIIKGPKGTSAVRRSVLLGSQYSWDQASLSQSIALLWRSKDDVDQASGWSGSLLCFGEPSAQSAKAVVFQNFQTGLRQYDLDGGREMAVVKGGFFLPREITQSTIQVRHHADSSSKQRH